MLAKPFLFKSSPLLLREPLSHQHTPRHPRRNDTRVRDKNDAISFLSSRRKPFSRHCRNSTQERRLPYQVPEVLAWGDHRHSILHAAPNRGEISRTRGGHGYCEHCGGDLEAFTEVPQVSARIASRSPLYLLHCPKARESEFSNEQGDTRGQKKGKI